MPIVFRKISAFFLLTVFAGAVLAQGGGGVEFCEAQKRICQPGIAPSFCCTPEIPAEREDCCVQLDLEGAVFTISAPVHVSPPSFLHEAREFSEFEADTRPEQDRFVFSRAPDPPPWRLQTSLALLQVRLT